MKKLLTLLIAVVMVCWLAVPAQAGLIDMGGGLIYDDVLDITWLQDANYAKTSGYDSDGYMNWNDAMAWAEGLEYYDSVRNVTWDDWRLPTALNRDGSGPCYGFGCSGSEMGHMFYTNLGGIAGTPISEHHNANYDLFTNIQLYYWSGTEYTPNPDLAWDLYFTHGGQYPGYKYNHYCAWAVRPGNVPIPGTLLLLGSGLAGIVALRKRASRT